MNERQEKFAELVVPRRDASELLGLAKEALDQVATVVQMSIERTRVKSMGAWRNDRLAFLLNNGGNEGVRIVALVGDDLLRRLLLDKRASQFDVGDLAGGEFHPQRVAQSVHGRVQLGTQPAARAADVLLTSFFGRRPNAGGRARCSSR